ARRPCAGEARQPDTLGYLNRPESRGHTSAVLSSLSPPACRRVVSGRRNLHSPASDRGKSLHSGSCLSVRHYFHDLVLAGTMPFQRIDEEICLFSVSAGCH